MQAPAEAHVFLDGKAFDGTVIFGTAGVRARKQPKVKGGSR